MYPGLQAKVRSQQTAFIMAQSGESMTYAELEQRNNRLAQHPGLWLNVPVLIDREKNVVAGHGRLWGLCELGWSEVPTLPVSITSPRRRPGHSGLPTVA
jgi:hypothetical protein